MQVILGAGGAISDVLALELKSYTKNIRLVSRNPQKINQDDELVSADLTKKNEVINAVSNAQVAYLTVGLPYKTNVWQNEWPIIMSNVIEACKMNKTKLVFFDNIYMYDCKYLDSMTEKTPIKACSKKGKVREQIANMLLSEIKKGEITGLIARAADFYGPGIKNSVLIETVFKNLKNGKKANWFCSLNKIHNFTYTPDAAKATALLGNSKNAYGKVWHLPTAEPLNGKQWIEKFAKELNTSPKSMVASSFMVKILGLFNPIMKEFVEMLYQYNQDYNFDSSKFESEFNMHPTPIDKAIQEIVKTG